jgi:uncharacterized protein (TIGR00255 family)
MRSMTGYARITRSVALGEWCIEIHSVNRKMLDITINMPKELLRFEHGIRRLIANSTTRGQLTVRIYAPVGTLFQATLPLLHTVKNFWQQTAEELGFDPKREVTLHFLVQQLQLFPHQSTIEENEEIEALLYELVTAALLELKEMKRREAKTLQEDMESRLHTIEHSLEKVFKRSSLVQEQQRQKLEEKLREFSLSKEVEAKLLHEIAVFIVDKLDITEEITRLRSHISQFFNYMQVQEKSEAPKKGEAPKGEAIGRTLDFLIQEMYREINTLGSKSMDIEISPEVIVMKSELEKIREQVQNIE